MRNGVFLFWVVLGTASAQTILTPDEALKLNAPRPEGPLKCQAQALKPVLDFSFRFRAGYTVSVPLDQYQGGGHKWTVLLQIQPEGGGKPVYLLDRFNIPDVPDVKVDGEAGGGYLLGEGHYHVTFLLVDDRARACRSDWDVDAKLSASNRNVRTAIKPGTVEEITSHGSAETRPRTAAPLGKLTVLLHAAPMSPSSPTVQPSDAVTLLGALSSLLDLAPARSVRLVVFNLEQRKEVYRKEQFTRDQLDAVREAIFGLQLATVDYHQLQNPTGHLDLLARLVQDELHAENPADAVVFLGPRAAMSDKVALPGEKAAGAIPKFFYVEYQMQPPRVTSKDDFSPWAANNSGPHADRSADRTDVDGNNIGQPVGLPTAIAGIDPPMGNDLRRDSIDYLVSSLKGKTLVVHSPTDFAKAMNQIAQKAK